MAGKGNLHPSITSLSLTGAMHEEVICLYWLKLLRLYNLLMESNGSLCNSIAFCLKDLSWMIQLCLMITLSLKGDHQCIIFDQFEPSKFKLVLSLGSGWSDILHLSSIKHKSKKKKTFSGNLAFIWFEKPLFGSVTAKTTIILGEKSTCMIIQRWSNIRNFGFQRWDNYSMSILSDRLLNFSSSGRYFSDSIIRKY